MYNPYVTKPKPGGISSGTGGSGNLGYDYLKSGAKEQPYDQKLAAVAPTYGYKPNGAGVMPFAIQAANWSPYQNPAGGGGVGSPMWWMQQMMMGVKGGL